MSGVGIMSSVVSRVRFQGVRVARFPAVKGDEAFEQRKAAMLNIARETCQGLAPLSGSLIKFAPHPTLCLTVQPDQGTIHILYSDIFKNLLKGPLDRLLKQAGETLGKPVGQEVHPLDDCHMPGQLQAVQDEITRSQKLVPTPGNEEVPGSPIQYRMLAGQRDYQKIFYRPR